MGKFSNTNIGMPIRNLKKSVSEKKGLPGRNREGWKEPHKILKDWGEGMKGPTNYGAKKGESRKIPNKILDDWGKGVEGTAFYGRPGEVSEEGEERGILYNDIISLEKFEKNLKHYDAAVKISEGIRRVVPREGDSIDISVEKDAYKKDFVKLEEVQKVADEFYSGFENGRNRLPPGVSRDEVKSSGQIYKFLAEKDTTGGVRGKGLEATMVLAGLFIFSFVGILLTMQKSGFTGFVVGNLADSSINTGVVLCILGIIGLLIYRFKFSD